MNRAHMRVSPAGVVFAPLLLWERKAAVAPELSDDDAKAMAAQQKRNLLSIAKCVEWLILHNDLVQSLFPSADALDDDDTF